MLSGGMDIIDPFPLEKGQVKFLLVAVDYFTKWVEVELGVANGPARPVLARPVCGTSKNGPGRAGPSNRNGSIITTRPV